MRLLRRWVAKARAAIRRARSPEWRRVEREHLQRQSYCMACLTRKHLQVHHIRPFHLHPELELDPRNLITLCMDTPEDHLRIGHLGDWQRWNPDVVRDAERARSQIGLD